MCYVFIYYLNRRLIYRMVYVDSRKKGGKIDEAAVTPNVRDRELVCVKFSNWPVKKQVDQHKYEKILLIGKVTSALGYDYLVENRVGRMLCSVRF